MRTRTATPTRTLLAGLGTLALTAAVSSCSMLGGGQVPTADVGDCLDMAELEGQISEIPTVDCSAEHDGQVFHIFDVEDADSYPGGQAVDTEAQEGCIAQFAAFVGADYQASTLEVAWIPPSSESWEAGDDREVICILTPVDGSTATESWEGSGV